MIIFGRRSDVDLLGTRRSSSVIVNKLMWSVKVVVCRLWLVVVGMVLVRVVGEGGQYVVSGEGGVVSQWSITLCFFISQLVEQAKRLNEDRMIEKVKVHSNNTIMSLST